MFGLDDPKTCLFNACMYAAMGGVCFALAAFLG